jgi:Maf-like protein
VVFRRLAESTLRDYVATGEPMDKAGAYGIQGYGAALVERIEGDFFSVMGLPVRLVLALLEEAGEPYDFGRGANSPLPALHPAPDTPPPPGSYPSAPAGAGTRPGADAEGHPGRTR